jgi:dihydrofolate reductase
MIALVVAAAANGVIGRDNRLPWHIAEDLRHFKRVTLGKPVVMGRKTFASIGRPLPGRDNIVITRDRAWRAEGVRIAHDIAQALALAGEAAETMVIGGAELYAALLPLAGRIYLTEIHRDYDGDATFRLPPGDWREISREDHPGDPAFSFVVLEKSNVQ